MTTSNQTVTFLPWIGSRYMSEGIRGAKLLVLGESHYGREEDLTSDFTSRVVQSKVYNGRHRFFTIIAKLILGKGAGVHIRQDEREWVWDRIAFYNYVQSMAGVDPNGNITDSMWQEARQPFEDVVEVTSPDAILVIGQDLGSHLPDRIGHSMRNEVEMLVINHVSRGFSYDPWQSDVQDLIEDSDWSGRESPQTAV